MIFGPGQNSLGNISTEMIVPSERGSIVLNDEKEGPPLLIGTFWVVPGGCGSAVLAATFPEVGIGLVRVSLAFGLSVLTMAYAVGGISGGHFNPAVSFGLWAGGRFPEGDLVPYVVVQVLGATAAAAILYIVASGAAGFDVSDGFAASASTRPASTR